MTIIDTAPRSRRDAALLEPINKLAESLEDAS